MKFNKVLIIGILVSVVLINGCLETTRTLSCGVKVVSVFDDSPLYDAGVQNGEVILMVDGNPNVRHLEELIDFINSRYKSGDEIHLLTNRRDIKLKLGENPQTGEPFLGADMTTNICQCGNGICEDGEQFKKDDITIYNYCTKDCE